MHRNKRKRNIIIFSLVGVLFLMVAGYAAFQTRLEIKGTSKVTSNWNILITNVTEGTPTGSAENAIAPKWDKLTASMEANLYDKGDAMEYDVTIENQGTIDAKLNDILTNLQNSNSEAVLITFSGYTKGEILKAKSAKIIHVKIEYNPEYEGGETSSEVTIDFDYGQNNNEENNPDDQYLLTYDYSTNGGQSVELDKEYMLSGSNVNLDNTATKENLDNTATKEGWTFVGWNTDKDAQIGLKEYQMPKENTTLYAIYSKDLKVTYEKEDTVESIGKNEDACTIYNNETSCEVTLPEINVKDESAKVSWYDGENKVGNPNDKYTITKDITLKAHAEFEPIIQSWSNGASTDFHAEEYRTNIITATFLDNKEVPSNAIASWDVSANKNGSVMAWVIADESDSSKYHLYIGGEGGVIANKDSSYLFYNFTNLQEITFGDNFDTSKVTSMSEMFRNCNTLTTLDVSKWDTSNVTDMDAMFRMCSGLITITFGDNFDTSKVTTMGYMFQGCSNLTTLDISKWETGNVTNMYGMFVGCSNLATLDISNWNTSKVTTMYGMFTNCSNLTTLDVSNFDTSNVTNMSAMFYNCSSLTILDVSDFDTSNVTDMSAMFYNCNKLIELNVTNFNTEKVTSMGAMFYNCDGLITLDLSNFNTPDLTNIYRFVYPGGGGSDGMFSDCSNLTKLILCNFNTSKVTNMDEMFQRTSNLKSIYVGPNWTTENATTDDMFYLSGVSEVTRSDNCEVMATNLSLNTLVNSRSITLVADADNDVLSYSFSNDNGKTWKESNNNVYTFNNLNVNSIYNTQIKANLRNGKSKIVSKTVSTSSLEKPLFKEKGNIVTITYPKGCGNELTCTYQKDNGTVVNVTSNTVDVKFTGSGSLVATVSDGTNTVSSSYTVYMK